MRTAAMPYVLITFGIFGSVFLGLVAGLGNIMTNEYIDYNLPGNPIIREYDFRIGGKYGLVTLSLLFGGAASAIGGYGTGFHILCKQSPTIHHSNSEKCMVLQKTNVALPVTCPQCKKKLPTYSKFCPKCGTDLIPNAATLRTS
ncbi:MAG: zinc-ribbon domain-containing protein [Candidatus Bathyarchaeota archaeon]|nr:zinc-ribbon domain-containing protein [Candidatus Bathyarchaeota archaeon]